ncbi:galactosyltransferase-related protein [Litoricolaceae bacterium]|nr:galactosyltransferase-related protein [Litorivicinaceae bacterium]
MAKSEIISLVITVYENSEALSLVCDSILALNKFPKEVVVADDGSGVLVDKVVQRLRSHAPVPVIRSWLPNDGYRAPRSRNLGVLKSSCPYIVMIDGDCLLPENFIANHEALVTRHRLVSGGRKMLSKSFSKTLAVKGFAEMQRAVFSGVKFFCFRLASLRKLFRISWKSARTCNLGFWKADFSKVSGFDEGYCGWGREDSDFVVRMQHAGCGIISARLWCSVAHFWHRETDRSYFSENDKMFNEILLDKAAVSPRRSCVGESRG